MLLLLLKKFFFLSVMTQRHFLLPHLPSLECPFCSRLYSIVHTIQQLQQQELCFAKETFCCRNVYADADGEIIFFWQFLWCFASCCKQVILQKAGKHYYNRRKARKCYKGKKKKRKEVNIFEIFYKTEMLKLVGFQWSILYTECSERLSH